MPFKNQKMTVAILKEGIFLIYIYLNMYLYPILDECIYYYNHWSTIIIIIFFFHFIQFYFQPLFFF